MTKYTYITKENSITVFINGKSYTAVSSHVNYDKILKGIKKGIKENKLEQLFDTAKAVKQYLGGDIEIVDGVLLYKGETLKNHLTSRIIKMMEDGFDIEPMVNFLAKLKQNPSRNSQQMLHTFLENNDLPITPEGNILSYKAVRSNYKDCHSNTFDNSIGTIQTMDRGNVDDVAENHCSFGFHVSDFSYANGFLPRDGHLMLCEVHPKDVVAVTNDASFRKMRVCEYKVVNEVSADGSGFVTKGASVYGNPKEYPTKDDEHEEDVCPYCGSTDTDEDYCYDCDSSF